MHVRLVLAASVVFTLAASGGVRAADLPPIKASEQNAVPECVTPGRLMAFIRSRNTSLDPRFDKIAVTYMRVGEELNIRWDVAFYQMAIETSYLTFKREGGRKGDVRAAQNNFAGLGATGNGETGESFPDVETGVRAHLQHVLMYSGETVENPVAERTRNVQKWGVLKSFHAKISGPVTYSHLAERWATSREYANALSTHARRFETEFCKTADPHPELLAEARGDKAQPEKPKLAAAAPPAAPDRVSGRDLARRAIEEAKEDDVPRRFGLGAAGLARQNDPVKAETEVKPKSPTAPTLTILNAPKPEPEPPAATEPAKPEKPKTAEKPKTDKPRPALKIEKLIEPPPAQTAALAPAQAPKPTPPAAGTKCKVFTASYGGLKAILIQAPGADGVHYTVLDVNDGNERREADAYIAAYAKGGQIAGEFSSPNVALDKAFELCPEG